MSLTTNPTKRKLGWFYDELYRMNYHLLFCETHHENMVKQFKEVHGTIIDFSFDFSEGGAYTVWREYEPSSIFIYLSDRDLSAFVHELVHAVDYTWDSRGIALDLNNDEPYAYYLGFLMEKLWPMVLHWEKLLKRGKKRTSKS